MGQELSKAQKMPPTGFPQAAFLHEDLVHRAMAQVPTAGFADMHAGRHRLKHERHFVFTIGAGHARGISERDHTALGQAPD